jgi:hypothetical protein
VSGSIRILILLAGFLAAAPAGAEEQLRVGAGAAHDTNFESTYGWQLDYAQGLSEHTYLTAGWINEGHQVDNYRDGLTAQIWTRATLLDQRLALALGVGGYGYFDTVRDQPHPLTAPYHDSHGLTLIASAELTWYLDQSWLAYMRVNRLEADAQHVTMLLLGVGYQFGGRAIPGPDVGSSQPSATGNDEFAFYLGRASLNDFGSEPSTAIAAEYRHGLSAHADWTLGFLDEESNDILTRRGLTTQLWLVDPVLDGRLTFGIGVGAYIVIYERNQPSFFGHPSPPPAIATDDQRVSGIITLMGGYRLGPDWTLRASFNRIVTDYDRDSDVILVGAGYGF